MKKIKISIAALLMLLLQVHLVAQESNEAQTLLKNTKPLNTENIGYFVAPALGFTQMDGSSASLFNVRGGINIKDKFSVGAYVATSINRIFPESETVPNVYMDYWSFGGFAEYTILSKKAFHLTLPLFIGYSEVQMDDEVGDADLGERNFFQVEPAAMLEVNVHKYVRFNLGAGYRFVENMNYRNFDQSNISGVTAYVGLKVGVFK
jgi:hypothetical protein